MGKGKVWGEQREKKSKWEKLGTTKGSKGEVRGEIRAEKRGKKKKRKMRVGRSYG